MKVTMQVWRNQRGSVAGVLCAAMFFMVVVIASLAFDVSHLTAVQYELQTATDSGALAGAQDLAVDDISLFQTNLALGHAKSVAEKNLADNLPVSSNIPGTTVEVTVNSTTIPRSIKVKAMRSSANTFARLLGFNTSTVAASSTATAFKNIKTVNSKQLLPIVVSVDTVPSKGPQKGVPLNTLYGPGAENQVFTISLNNQNEKNAAWIKNWDDTNSPGLIIGNNILPQNGVNASNIPAALVPGNTIFIPLIKGDPPFNSSTELLGVIGFKVRSVKWPQEIEGTLARPSIIAGVPGTPILDTPGAQDTIFLNDWAPWQVMLTE
ncbi:MAG: pilus assembly protein TadG-related protein [Candidatus Melainabacteria bacterium]|nr:pilus assembly protein TadG-related protein [Candidatus Melainabacteria bacterium]